MPLLRHHVIYAVRNFLLIASLLESVQTFESGIPSRSKTLYVVRLSSNGNMATAVYVSCEMYNSKCPSLAAAEDEISAYREYIVYYKFCLMRAISRIEHYG
jgi:hypothetical protein